MRTVPLKCSGCGAPLTPRPDGLVCGYCGAFSVMPAPPPPGPAPKSGPASKSGDADAHAGIEAYQAGNFTLAVQKLEQAVQAGAARYALTDLYTILGNACMELSQWDHAVTWYQRALALDARYHKAWVGLGITARKQGNLPEAERCYGEALRLAPDYAELHASLGALYIFQGKGAEAIRALEQALALDPSVAVAHGNLALALAMVGRFDEAEAALRQAVALGYKTYRTVQERIKALRALQE